MCKKSFPGGLLLLLFFFLLCVFGGANRADAVDPVYSVSGTVQEFGEWTPVEGVAVLARDYPGNTAVFTGTTNASGNFSIIFPGAGEYEIFDAVKTGYDFYSFPPTPFTLNSGTPTKTLDMPLYVISSSISVTIPLAQGWNLISIPVVPPDTAIATVLAGVASKLSIVWAYLTTGDDPGWKKYQPGKPSDLATMDAGNGYWVKLTSAGSLSVQGAAPSKSIPLVTGWNLVGYNNTVSSDVATALASISSKLSIVWAYLTTGDDPGWKKYQPGKPSDLATMDAGVGYWIKVTQDCTLTYP